MHKLRKFRDFPMIDLLEFKEDEKPFSFGLRKAQLILDNLDAIKKFIATNKKELER